MFGIGFSEILVIVVVLLIFVRPEDLPKFIRKAGHLYGKAKKMYNEIMQIKDKILQEIDEAASLEEKTSAEEEKNKTTPDAPQITAAPEPSDPEKPADTAETKPPEN